MTAHMQNLWQSPGPWFGLATGLGAPIIALAFAGVLPWGWAGALLVVPAFLMIQMIRTIKNNDLPAVTGSPAIARYTMRMMAASFAYVIGLMIAIWLHGQLPAGSPLLYAVTLLPTVPALGMIWAMFRYLLDETDEYLRHRASLASLIGLGIVLCLGTIWGFLETFGLVPNIFAWWVVPAWAMGLAIGQGILARQDTRAGEPS
ncbi:hypothetical protein [Erythrobacter crassostreae]|uniref:Uncharacterized protein n=1 Tax=Erythrobacter crassostreae TaxID=2828328 RepID=A0A9X1F1R6_9SPHN|nr:hypothetical protein [Erythrobacter crassostrea]MBV7258720.1 hypothetical protein [Erythrobacter crassostrea]